MTDAINDSADNGGVDVDAKNVVDDIMMTDDDDEECRR